MYTLRTIDANVESNESIGKSYSVVDRKLNYSAFSELFREHFKQDHCADSDDEATEASRKCYCFVITEDKRVIPLFKGTKYFIVTEGGKTFSNLTSKG